MKHFKTDERMTESFVLNAMTSVIKRIDACWTYQPTFTKLKSQAKLFKPQSPMIALEISEDYGLGQYFEKPLDIEVRLYVCKSFKTPTSFLSMLRTLHRHILQLK